MRHTSFYAVVLSTVLGGYPVMASQPAESTFQNQQGTESQNDLRQENDRLQQQVKSLEGDLAAAQKRIKELEDRIAQLEKSGVQTIPDAKAPEPVPPDPALGPGGLLSKLRDEYLEAFKSRDIPTSGPGADQLSQQTWAAHQRALESWLPRAQRGTVEVQWVGTIDPARVEQRGRDVTLTVVFTNGGRDFPTPITVDQGMVSRLLGPDGSLTRAPVTVNAIVTPRLRINSARFDAGPFEKPPLVGPFVEFDYDLHTKVLLPSDKVKPQPPKPADKNAAEQPGR
jgi:hypothetical protein